MRLPSTFFMEVAKPASFLGLMGLSCFSCSHPRPDEVPLHISLGGSYVDSQYVRLTVNSTPLYEKMWKRRQYQTTQCWVPNQPVTIHSRMGSHDTVFTLLPHNTPVYVSILYSRFHHKFMVQRHDSSAYGQLGAGSNDMIEYDAKGKLLTD
jgi:hypothetical protein